MGSVALHTALIWHDEVMHDLVLEKPRRITLGRDGRSTFTVPELGLPPAFAILRPGLRGYLLTLGARMRGTVCLDGTQRDVAALIAASPDGFAAAPIAERDWGVIELDESGHHKLFFQFVPAEEPVRTFTTAVVMAGAIGTAVSSAALTLIWALKGVPLVEAAFRGIGLATLALVIGGLVWSAIRKDSESIASLAFSVVLHTALLFMTYQVYVDENPFAWPGLRSLTGNYLVAQLDHTAPPPTPAPSAAAASSSTTTVPDRPAETAPPAPSAEPGGDQRPVARRAPEVQFLARKNREVLQGIVDRSLTPELVKFMALTGQPVRATGPGVGPGIGPGTGLDHIGTTKGDGRDANASYQPAPTTLDIGPVRRATCTGPGCNGTAPRAVIHVLPPTVDEGGLTQSEIDEVVKRRSGVFRQCYQRVLDHQPGLSGKLVVRFRIGGDGVVIPGDTSFVEGSTLRQAEVEQCIAANINRLKFPARGGVANVKYPFLFLQGQ